MEEKQIQLKSRRAQSQDRTATIPVLSALQVKSLFADKRLPFSPANSPKQIAALSEMI